MPENKIITNRQWFAVRVKPRQEEVAKLNFLRQGFTVYLPQVKMVRRHARKQQEVLSPLFPGYLFLHLAPAERRWETIASTFGALVPVKFGEHYPVVPDQVIAALRIREDEAGAIDLQNEMLKGLQPGDPVQVFLGKNPAVAGIFKAPQGKDRVLVLLAFLQRQVAVSVLVDDIRSAD